MVVDEPVEGNGETKDRKDEEDSFGIVPEDLSTKTNDESGDDNAANYGGKIEGGEFLEHMSTKDHFFLGEGPKIVEVKVADYCQLCSDGVGDSISDTD